MFFLRAATVADVDVITAQRRAMFVDMGHRDDRVLGAMVEAFSPWLRSKMQSEAYRGWLAIAPDGAVVAGAGLWLMDWPPHMIGLGAKRGNIVNVYTHPEFRRRGLARKLTETAIAWCRDHGISVVILHASQNGRALYESLGFRATNEMRLVLPPVSGQ